MGNQQVEMSNGATSAPCACVPESADRYLFLEPMRVIS
jgi:hypothetical protein